ncbi:MAG: hypothetical protein COB17_08395 [Sulfurimonas sp.]|nr:MAG: hypothetical protein COB17_08395 [Sulfurimonas sp.]
MWLNKLKIAIIEKDADKLEKLLEDIPNPKSINEAQEALFLLNEATDMMHILKDETSESMLKIKKNLSFIHSTQNKPKHSFEIKS